MYTETGSTRQQIMFMLKTEGPLTVSEMAERLGVTEMAVRRHLNTLERDGLIGAKLLRQAMGRPTNQYYLTEKSEEHFPKSYSAFTLEMLQDLEETYGPELVDQLFEKRKKRLTDAHINEFEGKSLREKVKLLADLQDIWWIGKSWRTAVFNWWSITVPSLRWRTATIRLVNARSAGFVICWRRMWNGWSARPRAVATVFISSGNVRGKKTGSQHLTAEAVSLCFIGK
jgi:DNA-binding MarR family transcriptional regulator